MRNNKPFKSYWGRLFLSVLLGTALTGEVVCGYAAVAQKTSVSATHPAIDTTDPVRMLRQIAQHMIEKLKLGKKNRSGGYSPQFLTAITQEFILPQVDLHYMAQSVVGRYWSSASASERQAFISEFVKLVLRTYSTALSSYHNQKIIFRPYRGDWTKEQRIKIYSLVEQSKGSGVAVDYRLLRHGQQWKVYDFSVDGISIVQSYRAQFSRILQKSGMSGLLVQLKQHNGA